MKASRLLVLGIFIFLVSLGIMVSAQPPQASSGVKFTAPYKGPQDVKFVGPKTGAIKVPVVVTVTGLPTVDLQKPISDATGWVKNLRFQIEGPENAKVEMTKELSMSIDPFAWRLRLEVVAETPGVYDIICDWNEAPFGLAVHRVTIGDVPSPVSAPKIVFTASPVKIKSGDASTLTWQTTDTTSVSLSNSTDVTPIVGSLQVKPVVTTIYVLTAKGPGGSASSSVVVEVSATPPAPDLTSDIAKFVNQTVTAKVTGDTRKAERRAVAKALRELAGDIEKQKDPKAATVDLTNRNKVQAASVKRTSAALGSRLSAWTPALDSISEFLRNQESAGKFGKTIYDQAKVFIEMALGLEAE